MIPGWDWFWGGLFVVASFFNARAVFKLLLDWKGMLTTCRLVKAAYAAVDTLPDERWLESDPRAPVFVHLVAAWQEPDIARTLHALLGSRYPHGKLHVVVVTREEEDRAPHPLMGVSTAELVRRVRAELPPWQQKMLSVLPMPGGGRKAHQLNWALRPEFLATLLNGHNDPRRVWIGVSDADSIPDPNAYRWIAADLARAGGGTIVGGAHAPGTREDGPGGCADAPVGGEGAPGGGEGVPVGCADAPVVGVSAAGDGAAARLAYQGVTLSLANFARLNHRGRVCAIQQSSIFIRVSIARLINERRRIAWFAALGARLPRLARAVRPVFEFCFRRSQICLGHNTFVRLDVLRAIGGFPTSGATEDSTLGYALGARGLLVAPLPMLELNDLPETTDKMVRQNARWYKGVLDDVGFLRRTWRERPSAYNAAQLLRHLGNKVVEWPIAAFVYPVVGFLGWHLAYRFADHPALFLVGVALPSISLALTLWVAGIVTQSLIESLSPYFPHPVDVARTSVRAKLWGTFRCQSYWLLATRGAWRVLWALAWRRRFEPAKTDRVVR